VKYKEVAICGCPRSGTTALSDLLNHDAHTWITHEVCNFNFGIQMCFKDKLARMAKIPKIVEVLANKNIPLSVFKSYYHEPFKYFDHVHKITGLHVLGDKAPGYIMQYEPILKRRPDCKIIIAIRDCRQVVSSCLRWKEDRPDQPWVSDNFDKPIDMWVNHTQKTIDLKEELGDDCLIVKYEDAVMHPQQALKDISEFVGHDFNIREPLEDIYYPVNLHSWKEEIPTVTKSLTEDAIRIMGHFNYDIQT
jgi:hypothetical protein